MNSDVYLEKQWKNKIMKNVARYLNCIIKQINENSRSIKSRKTIRDLKVVVKNLELAFCNLKDIAEKANKNLRNFGEAAKRLKINDQAQRNNSGRIQRTSI